MEEPDDRRPRRDQDPDQGDGAEVEDGDQVDAQSGSATATPRRRPSAPTTRAAPEQVTVDEQRSARSSRRPRGPDDRLAGRGHRPGRQGLRRRPATPSSDRQQGRGADHRRPRQRAKPLDGPRARRSRRPSWAPKLGRRRAAVTGLDFTKARRSPTASSAPPRSSRAPAPRSKKGQTITVNYLGQVYGGKKPFDESYSQGTPTSVQIGAGGSSRAGTRRSSGQQVGSRVLLAIPPEEGYGKPGPAAGRHQGHRHAVLRRRHPRAPS